MDSNASKRMRIAIIGGGMAGAILTRSLLECPQLDVQIYESSATFNERGAAIGLALNALRALKRIDPSLREDVKEAGGVESNRSKIIVVSQSSSSEI